MKFSKLIQGACVLLLVLVSTQVIAQDDATGDAVKELSKNKWQWMSDKNMDKLTALFHPQAQFVHMGGSWGTDRELEIIKNGFIWYKKADIQEVNVDVLGDTAILLNRITLLAEVGGNEVTNPFMVTEVYKKEGADWKLANLSFVKLLTGPPGD
ncbi:MAG: DUF4440 domain-containing protein [Cytophagaceae bacterium]|nr:DUF4440 domain-containing protein [Cytophagaceae bacterium]|tara:strand:+ start:8735 stop:9196 length:462 start_codon:yes stop_codon:yes gene_type:complete